MTLSPRGEVLVWIMTSFLVFTITGLSWWLAFFIAGWWVVRMCAWRVRLYRQDRQVAARSR